MLLLRGFMRHSPSFTLLDIKTFDVAGATHVKSSGQHAAHRRSLCHSHICCLSLCESTHAEGGR
jgi:hypothetical protein